MVTESQWQGMTTKEEETFQWTKQWYPVAVVEFLDVTKPHSIQLLGKNLVLWRDGSGKWRCFDDFCPHRGAPFSEGRIESDGTLLCAYHAWRFNGEGKCVSIPQSKDHLTEAKICQSERACAIAYPTQERQGLLWVWPECGSQSYEESQLREPRLVPELEEKSERVVKCYWNIRDLPYGWDYFMENVSDPAHVPVSHHGLVGNRYKDAKYYDLLPLRKVSTQEGFAFEITETSDNVEQALHDFQPPCHMRIQTRFVDGSQLILALYAVPTRPGWCRHIACQVLIKNAQGKLPKGLAFFALPMPTWLGHILASLFLHQDLVFLHYQEKNLANKGLDRWIENVYTPNPQDKMIVTFRNWLKYRAGGDIPWTAECNPNLPPPEQDKQKLFDVWTTHTQHCQVCQSALKSINRLKIVSYIASIVCLSLALFIDARTLGLKVLTQELDASSSILSIAPPAGFWGAIGGAILLAWVGYLLQKLSRLFYVYDFNHADND